VNLFPPKTRPVVEIDDSQHKQTKHEIIDKVKIPPGPIAVRLRILVNVSMSIRRKISTINQLVKQLTSNSIEVGSCRLFSNK
jgi:hypothetical protein